MCVWLPAGPCEVPVPVSDDSAVQQRVFDDLQNIVNPLYQCVMTRLMAQDQDQEVKDCAISCMAAAVSQLGDALRPHLPQVLQACCSTSWDCIRSIFSVFLHVLCLSFYLGLQPHIIRGPFAASV